MAKKFFRTLLAVLALMAAGSIVGHAAHFDAHHAHTASAHHCAICQTPSVAPAAALQIQSPLLVLTAAPVSISSCSPRHARLLDLDLRGPPALA